jgi:hypothetical protein
MKNSIYVLLTSISILWYACNSNKKITKATPAVTSAEMIAVFSNCKEPVGLFEFDGADFMPLQEITDFSRDTFRFVVPAASSRFYYVGTKTGAKRPVILGTENTVIVQGDCNNARQATFKNSTLNSGYDQLLQQFNQWPVPIQKKCKLQSPPWQRPIRKNEVILTA